MLESLLVKAEFLGTYELFSNGSLVGESPAIHINYVNESQNLVRKIKQITVNGTTTGNGIECIIHPTPYIAIQRHLFRNAVSTRYWLVTLDQHNYYEGLTDAVELIYSIPSLRPTTDIVITEPQFKSDKSLFTPARALIQIPQFQFIKGLF
jgi:hypothetical protein